MFAIAPPAPSFLDPCRDRLRVGPGVPAQLCGLAPEQLVKFALTRALHGPGDLGQKVGPDSCEHAQLPHRGGVLILGQLAPSCITVRRAGEPDDEDTVLIRAGP